MNQNRIHIAPKSLFNQCDYRQVSELPTREGAFCVYCYKNW